MQPTFKSTKPSRQQELTRLRRVNPARLIAMYRQAVGPNEIESLRAGITYDGMIEEILDYESRCREN